MVATNELQNLLRARYPRDQYAYFEELPEPPAASSNAQPMRSAFRSGRRGDFGRQALN